MWSPPNAEASQAVPQAGGVQKAVIPAHRNPTPMMGITRTEKAPPAMIATPYIHSHTPGRRPGTAARTRTKVRTTPTIKGGAKLNANFLAGPEPASTRIPRAFQIVETIP